MDAFNAFAHMAREARIMDQWKKIEDIEQRYAAMSAEYYQLAARHSDMTIALLSNSQAVKDADYYRAISDVTAAKLSLTSIHEELGVAQERYNELVNEVREEPFLSDEDDEDAGADACDCDALCDIYDDFECCPRERKTRNDIMGAIEAVRAQKVQKKHKLKPRSTKRDRTKTPEAKTKTLRTRVILI